MYRATQASTHELQDELRLQTIQQDWAYTSVSCHLICRYGCRLAADAHCTALVGGLRKAATRNKRARLFGRCLGLIEPVVPLPGKHMSMQGLSPAGISVFSLSLQ